MSVFLIYFEKKNPDASWTESKNKQEPIAETFSKVNDSESQLRMETVEILLDEKVTPSFIIHDGVSSDRIFQANFKKDPIVKKQRLVIHSFLEHRLTMNAFDHYLIFHLYHGKIYEMEAIEYSSIADVKLSDLMDFTSEIKRDLLYKLLS
jgi:hypothetical protein